NRTRKRRRRRHGKPVDAAAAEAAMATAAPPTPRKPIQVMANKPALPPTNSFLTRLGRKLRSLVSSD
ncbi:MAG TPA: ATP-dependent RNA helicase RhlB, partial [Stenotrophomonas sp.]